MSTLSYTSGSYFISGSVTGLFSDEVAHDGKENHLDRVLDKEISRLTGLLNTQETYAREARIKLANAEREIGALRQALSDLEPA